MKFSVISICSVYKDARLPAAAQVLVKLLESPDGSLCEKRKATRTLSLIFKSKPDLPSEQVTSAVCSLLELLCSDDDEVLTNVRCALSYCIDGIHGIIQDHNNWDIYDRLFVLLQHESHSVIIPVLKILVKIVDREKSWSYKFNPAYLGCLVTLLENHNDDAEVVTSICSIIYEIIECGNIEAVFAAGFIESLVNLIQTLKVLGGCLLHRGSV
ncbi:PREDICTED: importin subunit alpha-2-like isoform X2 [Nicotiana attenuata]|uniref:importin subunit alpha-2-like isoform X2 n=1 Tax=Nicotiana attenuata TaxID=49451 RepID=UPI000905BD32|nr:PREDICTED: importin subunit alpha-2-like isoform X2 [Nicotiana attenuata]